MWPKIYVHSINTEKGVELFYLLYNTTLDFLIVLFCLYYVCLRVVFVSVINLLLLI